MKILKDFPDFKPIEYASQGNAILGIRDSGKTVTAVGLGERLIDAGIPITVVDPIGRWRFMRVPGAGKGYPVVVAGGRDGDLPLNDQNAAEIVRAAMQNRVSLVLDLYTMKLPKAEWRRIMVAALEVMLYENPEYGLRHIMIEEAAEFCPQQVTSETAKVYDQVERLARMGGNALLGYTLVNQRSEQVNKAVLELCDNLILHRAKGKNSLLGLNKWLAIAGTKGDTAAIMASLPNLPAGRCWAWLRGSDQPLQVQVPLCKSFIPDRRAVHVAAAELGTAPTPVDTAAFVELMRETLEKAKPKKADARPSAGKLPPAAVPRLAGDTAVLQAYDKAALKAEYDRGRGEGDMLGHRRGFGEGFAMGCSRAVDVITDAMPGVQNHISATITAALLALVKSTPTPAPASGDVFAFRATQQNSGAATIGNGKTTTTLKRTGEPLRAGDIKAGQSILVAAGGETLDADLAPMLQKLVEFHPLKMTWSQLTTLLRIKARGGSFNGKRKRLLEQGWLVEQNNRLELQDQVWRVFEQPTAAAEPLEHFLTVLPQPASDILRILVEDGPHMPAAIAQRLGRQAVGGSWNTAISTLRANGLIAKRQDGGLEAVSPQ